MAKQTPDKSISTAQVISFLQINIFRGTATLPQIMSSGSGALEAIISAY